MKIPPKPPTSDLHPDLEVAAEDLHASEERFHQLVDAVTDYAIFMLDATGHVSTWNSGAKVSKGYEAHEILGKHFSIFYTAEDRAAGRPQRILDIVRREGRFEEESWRVRKDGTRFWANVVITPLRNRKGEVVGFAKVTRDLTAKRAIAEELRASEARFHDLIDAVTDYAILMLDAAGRVVTWNPGARKNKGYEANEILGKHFSIFYTAEDRAAGKPDMILDLVRREGRFEEEGWRVRKDGSRFWASVVITALRDNQGHVTGFAKVTRDLTAKRAAEESQLALTRSQMARDASDTERREMERVNRVKDDLLATISHELRTPLSAIISWVALLRRKPREESRLDHGLEVIERNARAQTRLVSELLDVSRIVNDKLQLTMARTEILPVLMSAVDTVRPSATEKGVRLVVDVDADIGATLADADRIQQVVWNLLTNAVRFTAKGGRVSISADRSPRGITIRVTDTGIGIAAESLPHIFERFTQVDNSTTRSHMGLGLGLAIVQHLVGAHGGSVEALSEGLGHGTTLTVSLPVRAIDTLSGKLDGLEPAAPGVSEAMDLQEPRASLQDIRLLVIDDDADSLEVLREVLEEAGAQVTTASSAAEALRTLDGSATFELIISDIGMPEMDGYDLIQRVRSSRTRANVPALALTAYAGAADASRALRAGFQEHLFKPIDEGQLLRAVRTWSQKAVNVN